MTYKLELSQADVALIMRSLGAQPLQAVLGTFTKIQQQIEQQGGGDEPV